MMLKARHVDVLSSWRGHVCGPTSRPRVNFGDIGADVEASTPTRRRGCGRGGGRRGPSRRRFGGGSWCRRRRGGCRACGAHRRQDAEFADLQRHFVVFGLVAERPGHAAAGRVKGFDLEAGDELQCLDRGADSGEGLLVAMAVQQRGLARHRFQAAARTGRRRVRRRRIPQTAGRVPASALLAEPGSSAGKFVAQGQQAGRFEPDDRRAGSDMRGERVDACAAPRFAPGRRGRRQERSGRSTAAGRVRDRGSATR